MHELVTLSACKLKDYYRCQQQQHSEFFPIYSIIPSIRGKSVKPLIQNVSAHHPLLRKKLVNLNENKKKDTEETVINKNVYLWRDHTCRGAPSLPLPSDPWIPWCSFLPLRPGLTYRFPAGRSHWPPSNLQHTRSHFHSNLMPFICKLLFANEKNFLVAVFIQSCLFWIVSFYISLCCLFVPHRHKTSHHRRRLDFKISYLTY